MESNEQEKTKISEKILSTAKGVVNKVGEAIKTSKPVTAINDLKRINELEKNIKMLLSRCVEWSREDFQDYCKDMCEYCRLTKHNYTYIDPPTVVVSKYGLDSAGEYNKVENTLRINFYLYEFYLKEDIAKFSDCVKSLEQCQKEKDKLDFNDDQIKSYEKEMKTLRDSIMKQIVNLTNVIGHEMQHWEQDSYAKHYEDSSALAQVLTSKKRKEQISAIKSYKKISVDDVSFLEENFNPKISEDSKNFLISKESKGSAAYIISDAQYYTLLSEIEARRAGSEFSKHLVEHFNIELASENMSDIVEEQRKSEEKELNSFDLLYKDFISNFNSKEKIKEIAEFVKNAKAQGVDNSQVAYECLLVIVNELSYEDKKEVLKTAIENGYDFLINAVAVSFSNELDFKRKKKDISNFTKNCLKGEFNEKNKNSLDSNYRKILDAEDCKELIMTNLENHNIEFVERFLDNNLTEELYGDKEKFNCEIYRTYIKVCESDDVKKYLSEKNLDYDEITYKLFGKLGDLLIQIPDGSDYLKYKNMVTQARDSLKAYLDGLELDEKTRETLDNCFFELDYQSDEDKIKFLYESESLNGILQLKLKNWLKNKYHKIHKYVALAIENREKLGTNLNEILDDASEIAFKNKNLLIFILQSFDSLSVKNKNRLNDGILENLKSRIQYDLYNFYDLTEIYKFREKLDENTNNFILSKIKERIAELGCDELLELLNRTDLDNEIINFVRNGLKNKFEAGFVGDVQDFEFFIKVIENNNVSEDLKNKAISQIKNTLSGSNSRFFPKKIINEDLVFLIETCDGATLEKLIKSDCFSEKQIKFFSEYLKEKKTEQEQQAGKKTSGDDDHDSTSTATQQQQF